jgi:hypothetical protein
MLCVLDLAAIQSGYIIDVLELKSMQLLRSINTGIDNFRAGLNSQERAGAESFLDCAKQSIELVFTPIHLSIPQCGETTIFYRKF